MQIIAELEGEGRGPYTGAFGYISRDGRLDSNILIRSMVWQRGEVSFRAGAGIVADSQPDAALQETGATPPGLLTVLEAGDLPRRASSSPLPRMPSRLTTPAGPRGQRTEGGRG